MVGASRQTTAISSVVAVCDVRQDDFDFARTCISLGHFDRDSILQGRVGIDQPFVSEIGVAESLLCFFGYAYKPADGVRFRRFERLAIGEASAERALRDDTVDLFGAPHAAIDQMLDATRRDTAHDLVVDERAIFLGKSTRPSPGAYGF